MTIDYPQIASLSDTEVTSLADLKLSEALSEAVERGLRSPLSAQRQ